jgi:ABC-type transport system involved in cytochrome c biogenesis permease component
MAVERNDAVLAALLMAPLDRGIIYLSKLLSNLALMLAVAAIVTPAGILFFGFDLSSNPLTFASVMSLSILGFAAVGTLFAAVVSSTRLQGGLLAMMVFPITLPLVIASTQLMVRAFRDGVSPGAGGIGILLAFDVIFLTASWLVFEWVLEP